MLVNTNLNNIIQLRDAQNLHLFWLTSWAESHSAAMSLGLQDFQNFLRGFIAPYLHGVGADYFSLKPFSELNRQFGLSGAGSSQNHHQRRDHSFPADTLHTGRRHDTFLLNDVTRMRTGCVGTRKGGSVARQLGLEYSFVLFFLNSYNIFGGDI